VPKPIELRVMGDRIISQIKMESRLMTPVEEVEYIGGIYGALESRLGELDLDESEDEPE
jgi:hypothetical protein